MVFSPVSANSDVKNFTKCILENGCGDVKWPPKPDDWFEIDIKKLFDSRLLTTNITTSSSSHRLESLLGFKLNTDSSDTNTFTRARIRLGHFGTHLAEIVHEAIGEMRLGERAQLSFELDTASLEDGENPQNNVDDTNPPIFIDIKFEIVLVKIVESTKSIYLLDTNELITLALEHKTDANEIFKLGRIRTAFKRYKKSIDYLIVAQQLVEDKLKKKAVTNQQRIEEEGNEEEEEENELKRKVMQMKCQVYSNLALCQFKCKSYELVVVNCTRCLAIEANNVKALFRRAQARTSLSDFDEAIEDFKRVLEIEPDNREVKEKMLNCEKLRRNSQQAMMANLKKLFI